MHYDVFNGDADGILALVQLRLHEPKKSTLVTGVKRDISLVKNVDIESATSVTVLDISMEKNIDALNSLLANKIKVDYIDHHRPGDIPDCSHLNATIDIDANTCTSLLVNDQLGGKYVLWAIAAAYGDNMIASAEALAAQEGLSIEQSEQLKALGIYINYNGYGRDVSDLHFAPNDLFNELVKFENPFDLISQPNSVYQQLATAYENDMANATASPVLSNSNVLYVVELVDEPWARRVSGVYGNDLANQSPEKAHAVFTLNADDTYTVSLRAPLNNKLGAGDICAQFESGGGRAAAGGINSLPKDQLSNFIEVVSAYYTGL